MVLGQLPPLRACHRGGGVLSLDKPWAVERGTQVVWGSASWKSARLVGIMASTCAQCFILDKTLLLHPI